jgi:glycosyltransferase involved in cell wall biosynthesis
MNILLNYSTVNGCGATQVALANLIELKKYSENNFVVVLSPSFKNHININIYPVNFKFIWLKKHITSSLKELIRTRKFLNFIERKENINVVFSIFGPSYWTPKSKHLMGYAIPHYVYPESPFFRILSFKNSSIFKIKKVLQKIFIKNNSDYYHTETIDVKNRLSSKFNIPKENIFEVPATIHPCYLNKKLRENIDINISNKFDAKFISISSTALHKNLSIIEDVIPILKSKYNLNIQFILTLPNDFFNNNFKNRYNNILNIGPVKIENCPSLYEQSDFVFSPSLLECFSAVYAEAMFMKKPLLVSDLPFSHVVCKDAAVYFDPLSPSVLAEKISFLANNKEVQSTLIKKGENRFKDFPSSKDRTKSFMNIIENLYTNKL